MEVTSRLGEIDEALAAVPTAERRAAAGPVLAELCLPELPIDEDAAASMTRRAIYLAAAAGAVADAPRPGGRPVLETAAELADAGLAPALETALRRLADAATLAGATRVAETAGELAACPGDALEALAVVLLTTTLAE